MSSYSSPVQAFPSFDMSMENGHRQSGSAYHPSEPIEFGGAFSNGSGADINSSYMPSVQEMGDPREDHLFMTAPAPSVARRSSLQPLTTNMSRHRSDHRGMSAIAYPVGNHDAIRPVFSMPNNEDFQPPPGTFSVTNDAYYRENTQAPGSFTASSVSHGAHSHRSSSASNYNFPQTPLSENSIDGLNSLHVSTSPQFGTHFEPGGPYASHNGHSPSTTPYDMSPTASMGPPAMARAPSARSQKEKKFPCEVHGCTHGRPFGTRNDLDRHKLAVHKIVPASGNTKIYVCQGATCKQQGKQKVWPRKDNFKNHCKVAHSDEYPESKIDDLIQRSERLATSLKPHELENLVTGESSTVSTPSPGPPAARVPDLRLSLAAVSQAQRHNNHALPPHSPDHLSPIKYQRHSLLQSMQRSPSASSVTTIQHRRSVSSPNNAHQMHRHASDPQHSPHDVQVGPSAALLEFLTSNGAPAELIASLSGTRGVKRPLEAEPPPKNGIGRPQKCPHPECGKTFKRPCDLRKHMTRHTKPWGCTDPECHKKFGSKNDWKRHELSRHYQLAAWICNQSESNEVGRCTKNCSSEEDFHAHLQQEHKIHDKNVRERITAKRHIGRNWAVAVWCGFCRRIIRLTRENQDAWNERFDHIDSHLTGSYAPPQEQLEEDENDTHILSIAGKKQKIWQWVPPDTDQNKGKMKQSMAKSSTGAIGTHETEDEEENSQGEDDDDEDDDEEEEEEEEEDEEQEQEESPSKENEPESEDISNSTFDVGELHEQITHNHMASQHPTKKRKMAQIWYCDDCQQGPFNDIETQCINCNWNRTGLEHTELMEVDGI